GVERGGPVERSGGGVGWAKGRTGTVSAGKGFGVSTGLEISGAGVGTTGAGCVATGLVGGGVGCVSAGCVLREGFAGMGLAGAGGGGFVTAICESSSFIFSRSASRARV